MDCLDLVGLTRHHVFGSGFDYGQGATLRPLP
jgi:hypothetical protein